MLENKEWQYVENNRQLLLAGTCIMQRVPGKVGMLIHEI